ncbi:MAG: GNAT family N-acetyltransferase [Cellulomonas sp.]
MTSSRLRPWFESGQERYVEDLIRSGKTPEQAREKASDPFEQYFPDGVATTRHLVFDVVHDVDRVGYVWIGPQSNGGPGDWWLWDLEIDEPHRGHGFGRAALVLAEAEASRNGATTLGLNVFGFNTAARSLYASSGYATVALQLAKRLG